MFRVHCLVTLLSFCSAGLCVSIYSGEDVREEIKQKKNAPSDQRTTGTANGFWDPLGLPVNFDARQKWVSCPSIGHVHDQGSCKSSYAVAVASAAADRACVHSNGTETPSFSAQQILSCCFLCGDGCDGGMAEEAWYFYARHGLVSGGDYGSKQGCQPYTIQPCIHGADGTVENSCASKPSFTPDCKTNCYNPTYGIGYRKDHYKGKYYRVQAYQAMREIYDNGPITASFFMYSDFLSYKSGIYMFNETIPTRYVDYHAVKILGWGEENGTPYWLAANSFNTYWGENGFFKILRGANECYIEESMYAGLPL